MTRLTGIFTAMVAALAGACTNPEVPAGHEGYIYHVPLMFGQMEYREVLRGPASTGVSWRLYTENIDMRTRSFAEEFQLLTKENLEISFEVNTRISLRDGSAKEIVESLGGKNWYEWNVKEPLRTIVREQVTEFRADQVQLQTAKIRDQISQKLNAKFMDPQAPTPVVIESVDIGQIKFPTLVAEAIDRKNATKQELERQKFLLAKTEKEAAIKVLDAINVAKQQLIISSTLDPLYVQQRAVQVYRGLAESPNRTMIVLPNSVEGTGMPKILIPTQRRILSEADKTRLRTGLDALEQEYSNRARSSLPAGEEETGGAEETKEQPAEPAPAEAPADAPAATDTPAAPAGQPPAAPGAAD